MLKTLIFFLLVLLGLQTKLYSHTSYSYSPVFSFATLPTGIKQKRREYGFGLSIDTHWFGGNYWRTGPGLALMATVPIDRGNSFVGVSPYSIYAEPRWTYWLVLEKNKFSVTPFVGLKSMMGAQIIRRHVDASRSSNMLWLLAFGPRVGIAYWYSNFGLACAYDISFGTNQLRQEINLSLSFHNI